MDNHSNNTDIIIAGGGLVGLSLALALSGTAQKQSGLNICLIDPQDLKNPKSDSRAFSLSASSKNMLEALNLWDKLEDQSQIITTIDISDTKLTDDIRPTLLHFENETEEGDPAAYVIESNILQKTLYDAAQERKNISFLPSSYITDFSKNDLGITITTNTGKTIQGKLLAACDGRSSKLRQKAGIKTVEWPSKQTGITTTLKHTLPHHGRAIQHFLPSGPFAMLPLTDNRTSVIWTETSHMARKIQMYDDQRFIEEIKRRATIDLGTITLENRPAFFPLSMNVARDYVQERFALVGDSAHGMHWIAGQGLNFGLRDVAALSQLVIKTHRLGLDIGSITTLKEYERWRRFDSFTFTACMATLNSLFSHDNFATRAVRDLGLKATNNIPSIKNFFIKEASGLSGELPRLLKGERL